MPGEQLQRSFFCTFRRNANFAHSASQRALSASQQLSGDGRHFRCAAARPDIGRAASASGENGNFGGQKRNKPLPPPPYNVAVRNIADQKSLRDL